MAAELEGGVRPAEPTTLEEAIRQRNDALVGKMLPMSVRQLVHRC
jgi:hypothetical protein